MYKTLSPLTTRNVTRWSVFRFVSAEILVVACLFILPAWQVSAAWFEASGQAVIVDGDKASARQQATEEAIKQAMLFSGASVRSIQTLTNGLLSDDRFQVASTGEVAQLELIDEVWDNDYVTVTIRADIFVQASQCSVAAYRKTLSTTVFPVSNRQHMQDGQIQSLPEVFVRRLQERFRDTSDTVSLHYIAPYAAQWGEATVAAQAPALARQTKTQYVIAAELSDLSVERHAATMLTFWQGEQAKRHFGILIRVIDGMNGGTLLEKQYRTSAPWQQDRFTNVDVTSQTFWQSPYGRAVSKVANSIVTDITDAVACQPLIGRVILAQGDQLQVSLGRDHGVSVGDELFIYKTRQITDAFGQHFQQYNIYPGKVRIVAAYADTSTVEPVEGAILSNIQPNDFVAFR
ncbi:flagellar assembly protein T N-terminal domain-containing protein [Alteromonas sp. CYL-A6]|uniref:flagellar assembly protein T N-terminal domain-containing protein n=1 Tax=Alteromonas nitratireducens TaxID=3390813 RepID=UPI0034BB0BC2